MKLLSLLVIFGLALVSLEAFAQPGPPPEENYLTFLPDTNAPSRVDWMLGASYLRWNEELRLQKNALLGSDTANFSGLNLNLERRTIYTKWGWGGEVNFGSGRANGGGGDALVPYSANNQKWSSFGATLKGFYRFTPQVSLGASLPLLMRNVTWTTLEDGTEANSGNNFNLGLLVGAYLRFQRNWEFYQEIGTLGGQGATFWHIGLGCRL